MMGLTNLEPIERVIAEHCRNVRKDRSYFSTLSTKQRCAVALVLDDYFMMKVWGSALDCMLRLDSSWLQACWNVQRTSEFVKPPLEKRRRFAECMSDDELANIADRGGLNVECWEVGAIARELLARRAGQRSEPVQ